MLLLLLSVSSATAKLIDQTGSKMLANLLDDRQSHARRIIASGRLQLTAVHGLSAFLIRRISDAHCRLHSLHRPVPKVNPDCGIDRFSAMYSNCGFIGIPLVQSIQAVRAFSSDRLHDRIQYFSRDARHDGYDWKFFDPKNS